MDTSDRLLMPPPPPQISSKKRPRSITIYSEEEAYAPSLSRSICTFACNRQLPVQGLKSHVSYTPKSSGTWATPSPQYDCNMIRIRPALRSLQPKFLTCDVTGDRVQTSNDAPNDMDDALPSVLDENSNHIETLETHHFTAVVARNLKSPTMEETQNYQDNSISGYNNHNSIHFTSAEENDEFDEPHISSTMAQEEVLCKNDDSPKSRFIELNDSPKIATRFVDIIGHGAAKLRLEEAILPLALPPSLVHSVLKGMCFMSSEIVVSHTHRCLTFPIIPCM